MTTQGEAERMTLHGEAERAVLELAVVVATDAPLAGDAAAFVIGASEALCRDMQARAGICPKIWHAHLGEASGEPSSSLGAALAEAAAARARIVLVVPLCLGLDLGQKQHIADAVRQARRLSATMAVHYDEPDPCDGLLIAALVDRIAERLSSMGPVPAERLGILLAASGRGDAAGRAASYALMRLLWEHTGAGHGEIAFLRHDRPALAAVIERCAQAGKPWVLVPQYLWPSEHLDYMAVIRDDVCRRHPAAGTWPIAAPLSGHPGVVEWLRRRVYKLWDDACRQERQRRRSARQRPLYRPATVHGPGGFRPLAEVAPPQGRAVDIASVPAALRYGDGLVVDIGSVGAPGGRGSPALAELVAMFGITAGPVVVKVTWHGYAPGTYTDPTALDALLAALPGPVLVVESHTASRNRGGTTFDWERESEAHRSWIADEDRAYRERTGLQAVLDAHKAVYINVTEAWWDGACASPEEVAAAAPGLTLHHPELMRYVPRVLLGHAGAPCISFARFKGPTRLGIANLFGLIPAPLRSAWHGPNITYFARVCCDLARLYGALFRPFGCVESLDVAVRWDRAGLYRSRWGNYDLIERPGIVCMSRGFATADVLASRLQGQEVTRSAFFDVVASELGMGKEAAEGAIDPGLRRRFL